MIVFIRRLTCGLNVWTSVIRQLVTYTLVWIKYVYSLFFVGSDVFFNHQKSESKSKLKVMSLIKELLI